MACQCNIMRATAPVNKFFRGSRRIFTVIHAVGGGLIPSGLSGISNHFRRRCLRGFQAFSSLLGV